MNSNRVADVLLGLVTVVMGVAPTALFLFGLATGRPFAGNLGTMADAPFSLFSNELTVRVFVALFGLFFAGMGVFTAKYGRSDADGPRL